MKHRRLAATALLLGWSSGSAGTLWRSSKKNTGRLRTALEGGIERIYVSGTALHTLLGHLTGCALMRREARSIVHACYAVGVARLNPGQFYVVDFNIDDELYHERPVLCMNLANDQCAVLTPDGDRHVKPCSTTSDDITDMTILTGHGGVPPRMGRTLFYRVDYIPMRAVFVRLVDPHVFAARRVAAEEVRQQAAPGTPAVKGNDDAETRAAALWMPLLHSMTLLAAGTIGTLTGMGSLRHAEGVAFLCASH